MRANLGKYGTRYSVSLHKTIKMMEITKHRTDICIFSLFYTSSWRPMLPDLYLRRCGDVGPPVMPGAWGMWLPLGDNCLPMNFAFKASLPPFGTHLTRLKDATTTNMIQIPYAIRLPLWGMKYHLPSLKATGTIC